MTGTRHTPRSPRRPRQPRRDTTHGSASTLLCLDLVLGNWRIRRSRRRGWRRSRILGQHHERALVVVAVAAILRAENRKPAGLVGGELDRHGLVAAGNLF